MTTPRELRAEAGFTSNTGTLSPEDVQARLGKLTASRMSEAMHFLKRTQKPPPPGGIERRVRKKKILFADRRAEMPPESSQERKDYMAELVAERMTDILVPHYVTPAMQWGIDNEPQAKLIYVATTGNQIQQAGYIDHPEIEYCGATPDAYTAGGLVEIKCPTTSTFIEWILYGVVPEEHKPQMALQLLCTGREWVDFCAFDPRMPESRKVFIRRYVPTAEELAKVEAAAKQFLAETESLFRAVTEAKMT